MFYVIKFFKFATRLSQKSLDVILIKLNFQALLYCWSFKTKNNYRFSFLLD